MSSWHGPWYQIYGYTFNKNWDKYSLPPKVRHGCMIPIKRSQYDNLVRKFGLSSQQGQDTKKAKEALPLGRPDFWTF
ncbi:MAG TPA: hypothetical protein VMW24_23555 [Sedimentisphaerales bacterium]|nr:hypothetical protein [Sedimentisphaerales bacterium]